jgi:type IV pilus assembly protein PilV
MSLFINSPASMLRQQRLASPSVRLGGLKKGQHGIVLLEALIAILIFSIGILGIVGLQATAIKNSGDAKFRADASQLSSELFARMWSSDRTSGTLVSNYSGTAASGVPAGGAGYQSWATDVLGTLPGNIPPVVAATTDNSTATPGTLVTVTISWQAPNDKSPHQQLAQARISQ